jgi:hypothetical protein
MAAALDWAANQPDLVKNAQNCLQMRVDRKGSGVVLNGRECKERYVYACQVKNLVKTLWGLDSVKTTTG